jgi:hypothetical protein
MKRPHPDAVCTAWKQMEEASPFECYHAGFGIWVYRRKEPVQHKSAVTD